jgi:hypothetical protein
LLPHNSIIPINLGRHNSDGKIKLHSTGARAVPLKTGGGQEDLQITCFIYTTTASGLPPVGIDGICNAL